MPGSILQLTSVGKSNVYLTEKPEINIFKYSYYRYANFAVDTLKVQLNEIAAFDKKISCTIPKYGHLLSKLYLRLKLPALSKTSGTYACYSDSLGYSIFDQEVPIELEIGGSIVEKIYPRFSDLYNDFRYYNHYGRNLMVGKSDIYNAAKFNALKPFELIIPLDFWFTKKYNMALPVVSMPTQDIKIIFKFEKFENLINYDGTTPPTTISILDSEIYAEYIFLDDTILQPFKDKKHSYLIEQTQYHGKEVIPANYDIHSTTLKFTGPLKQLFIACSEKQNIEKNNYFVYNSSDDESIIKELALYLDGKPRFDYLSEIYYRLAVPYSIHTYVPNRFIYNMPFCLLPEDNQPSGHLDTNAFSDVSLLLKLNKNPNELYLFIYAQIYNIVSIDSGSLVFENI